MSANKWTPGPWAVIRVDGQDVLMGFGIDSLTDAFDKPGPWRSEWMTMPEADARLIAAAPLLYAALESVLDSLGALAKPHELLGWMSKDEANSVFAALATARGERHE